MHTCPLQKPKHGKFTNYYTKNLIKKKNLLTIMLKKLSSEVSGDSTSLPTTIETKTGGD